MLHGVIDPTAPAAWKPLRTQITTDQLFQTLAVLSRYYNFISLPEATEMLAGTRPLVANGLAFTFDDGYRNSLKIALPILRRFNAPATIFLSTGNVTDQKPFWFDRLDYAVQLMNNDTVSRYRIPELTEIDFSTRETLVHSFITFIRKEKKRYTTNTAMRSAMAELTERMEQCSGHGLNDIFADDPSSGVLNWNEVKRASTEIHFGSHSVDHSLLGLISPHMAKQELIASREEIEFHTGRSCTHLAYPDGSFNDTVLSLVRTCGYFSAVTDLFGLNRKGDEMLTLRRISIPNANSPAGIITAALGVSSLWHKIS